MPLTAVHSKVPPFQFSETDTEDLRRVLGGHFDKVVPGLEVCAAIYSAAREFHATASVKRELMVLDRCLQEVEDCVRGLSPDARRILASRRRRVTVGHEEDEIEVVLATIDATIAGISGPDQVLIAQSIDRWLHEQSARDGEPGRIVQRFIADTAWLPPKDLHTPPKAAAEKPASGASSTDPAGAAASDAPALPAAAHTGTMYETISATVQPTAAPASTPESTALLAVTKAASACRRARIPDGTAATAKKLFAYAVAGVLERAGIPPTSKVRPRDYDDEPSNEPSVVRERDIPFRVLQIMERAVDPSVGAKPDVTRLLGYAVEAHRSRHPGMTVRRGRPRSAK